MKKTFGLLFVGMFLFTLFGSLLVGSIDARVIVTDQQITSNGASQENPDIYEYGLYNYTIVYQDNRNGNWDIYMYAPMLNNWEPEFRLTNNSANQINPKIYGDIIVFQDNRNGNWDIYTYNITSKVETQITNNTASQEYPAIYGDIIVWQDNRDGHWGIYLYNLTSQIEQVVYVDSWTTYNDYSPAIYGNRVVWVEAQKTSNWDSYWLMCKDLSTGTKQIVESHNSYLAVYEGNIVFPVIYGDHVAWLTENNQKWNRTENEWQIQMKDLATGFAVNITDKVPDGALDIYDNYIVFERDTNSTITDLFLYNIDSGIESKVTNSSYTHMRPAISAKYGNYIVYMDYRNGNSDIYLTGFGYGVTSVGGGLGAQGPSSSLTPLVAPTSSNQITTNSDQDSLTIIILLSVLILAVVLGLIFYLKKKQNRHPKEEPQQQS